MDADIPTEPEWLAFDFEHAYRFAFGRAPHVLTLATARALRVLNFDGLSAHLAPETQAVVMYGEVRGGSPRPRSGGASARGARGTGSTGSYAWRATLS